MLPRASPPPLPQALLIIIAEMQVYVLRVQFPLSRFMDSRMLAKHTALGKTLVHISV
jgi:hypothetical protein